MKHLRIFPVLFLALLIGVAACSNNANKIGELIIVNNLTLNDLEQMAEHGKIITERFFAQDVLASVYKNGEKGVPQNYEKAAKWYRLGAEQGRIMAQFELGSMYRKGQGVPKDYVLAYMWLDLAADSGFLRHAVNARDYLAKKMTPAQIEKAKELSRECKAKNYRNC